MYKQIHLCLWECDEGKVFTVDFRRQLGHLLQDHREVTVTDQPIQPICQPFELFNQLDVIRGCSLTLSPVAAEGRVGPALLRSQGLVGAAAEQVAQGVRQPVMCPHELHVTEG